MIDRIIEFIVGILIISIILVYTVPHVVDGINYVGAQIQRINF